MQKLIIPTFSQSLSMSSNESLIDVVISKTSKTSLRAVGRNVIPNQSDTSLGKSTSNFNKKCNYLNALIIMSWNSTHPVNIWSGPTMLPPIMNIHIVGRLTVPYCDQPCVMWSWCRWISMTSLPWWHNGGLLFGD